MTPVIDGKIYHFEARGLYDGVSLLMDRETGSYWHHITGECLGGPLAGVRLAGLSNLLQMSVSRALEVYPDIQVAISDRRIRGRKSRWWPLAEKVPLLPDRFRATMAGEDTRRPTMDVGLGVWTDGLQRYYPLEVVAAASDFVIDELGGQRLLVYFDPTDHVLTALYSDATSASWNDEELRLSNGDVIRAGVLLGADGARKDMERPLQVFTRWYGFALTFPATEVYEGSS